MLALRPGGLVTAICELREARMVMIVGTEKVLTDFSGTVDGPTRFDGIESLHSQSAVLYADDSTVARRRNGTAFGRRGIRQPGTENGGEAWRSGCSESPTAPRQPACRPIRCCKPASPISRCRERADMG